MTYKFFRQVTTIRHGHFRLFTGVCHHSPQPTAQQAYALLCHWSSTHLNPFLFHSDRNITEMVNGHTANESIGPVWCTPGHSSRFPIFPGLHQWHHGHRLQKHYNPSICKWLFIVLTPEENNKDEDQGWLQCDLDALDAWAEKWGMHFNLRRCQIMWIEETTPVVYTCKSRWTPWSRTSPMLNTLVCSCRVTSTRNTGSAL